MAVISVTIELTPKNCGSVFSLQKKITILMKKNNIKIALPQVVAHSKKLGCKIKNTKTNKFIKSEILLKYITEPKSRYKYTSNFKKWKPPIPNFQTRAKKKNNIHQKVSF